MQIKPGYTTVRRNATNSDLQRAIEVAIPQAVRQCKSIASRYQGKTEEETCKKIFDYLKNNINYKADGVDQQVRLPSALMRTAQGDCKSYAVFTSAILSNLGIPHKLVYASYDPTDSTPSHIYVVTDKGCIIDAVYGKFNAEKKATYKKYKNMNIAYIAGVKPRKIGRSCGYSGIGAVTGETWAKKLGIWDSIPTGVKINFRKNLVLPPYIIAREVVKSLLRKNAGGFANSLSRLYEKAKADNSSSEFKKYRAIELEWLQKGGNPDDLRVAFQDGNTKTPTGKYFNKLMKMKAGGYNPNPAQWIAAGVSVLFGKKYNETTGQITGNNTGIGQEPATATGLLATAPIWVQFVAYVSTAVGSAYVVSKVGGPNDIPGEIIDTTTTTNTTTTTPGVGSKIIPLLLLGGAGVAAYFYFNKKK